MSLVAGGAASLGSYGVTAAINNPGTNIRWYEAGLVCAKYLPQQSSLTSSIPAACNNQSYEINQSDYSFSRDGLKVYVLPSAASVRALNLEQINNQAKTNVQSKDMLFLIGGLVAGAVYLMPPLRRSDKPD